MTALESIRQQIREKRAALDALTAACQRDSEHPRDMTPEENTQFDKLVQETTALKSRAAQLEALGDVPEEAPAVRSTRRAAPVAEAPAIHTDATKQPYSVLRAIRMYSIDHRALNGLEGEVEQEIIARNGGKRPTGIYLPTGANPEIRKLMANGRKEQRDLTTTTGAGTIFNIPELPLIDFLRARLVVRQLGARFLTDMQGLFSIPRQTGTAQVYWVGEGVPTTASNPTTDQVMFTPKVAIALTNLSRQFINQTSLDAEEFIKADLAASMARELDRVAINGSGGTQPLGILQNPAILTNSAGLANASGNGGNPSYATVVGMESQVAGYNADVSKLAYLTNPGVRGYLKQATKTSPAANNGFVWEKSDQVGVGEVNNYLAYTTSNVPKNLTKGTGTGLSALIFGNWDDLVLAMWEGVDFIENPYSGQGSGTITYSSEMSLDVEVRHPESFAVVTDAKVS